MDQDRENAEETVASKVEPSERSQGARAERAFWLTLALLFLGTLVLGLFATIERPTASSFTRGAPPSINIWPKAEIDIPTTRIEEYIRLSAERAYLRTSLRVDNELDRLFSPVKAGVEAYADFHFSVLGEYAELITAAISGGSSTWERVKGFFRDDVPADPKPETQAEIAGLLEEAADRLEDELEGRLYPGFDDRLASAVQRLDSEMLSTFQSELQALVATEITAAGSDAVLSQLSQQAVDDAISRAMVGKPISVTVAVGVGTVSGKLLAGALSKTALKAGLKTAVKPLTVGGGAAGGAALGALLGPVGATVGGAAGALIAWFAVDFAVIRVDEALNRESFEAELLAGIEEQQSNLRELLLDELDAQRKALASASLRERLD